VLVERCSDKECRDNRCSDDVLTFLRAACMDPHLEDDEVMRQKQGSVLALLLLAGASDLASARESCGTCYETPCNPVTFGMDEFPLAVLDACTAPAAQRAAEWPRVLRRLAKEEKGAPRESLARALFLELCCQGTSPNFFEEWEAEEW
jgi:hypothetical protein